ncbi:MAG: NAD(P)-dependent oxidoreductase [Acidobacteriota bacterium]
MVGQEDRQQLPQPILVTGALGFIGRRLVTRLAEAGAKVIASDLASTADAGWPSHVRYAACDVRDAEALESLVRQARTLFHLAAIVGDWGTEAAHRAITVEGTEHVLRGALASQRECRVVLASSIVVYGGQLGRLRCHERLAMGRTFGPYSRSKQAQERLARRFGEQGLDVRIVRPANVYGAGSKPWVTELCRELERGTPALVGGGDFDAGLVHVDNVVEVMLRAAGEAGARGGVYNAADEDGVTWRRYMTDLASITGCRPPRSIPRPVARLVAAVGEGTYRALGAARRPPLTREALNLVGSRHQICMRKARSELDYRPVTDYESGLREIELSLQI